MVTALFCLPLCTPAINPSFGRQDELKHILGLKVWQHTHTHPHRHTHTHYCEHIPGNLLISQPCWSSVPTLIVSCHSLDQKLYEQRWIISQWNSYMFSSCCPAQWYQLIVSAYWKKTSSYIKFIGVFFGSKEGLPNNVGANAGFGFEQGESKTQHSTWVVLNKQFS